ncbi:hypothetical protein [Tardiphaga sp.]|uniref:hypothetical protein n=1 Tax=Tardiphaga sp. TaxID=1926292 RepID=UPI0037D9B9F2
MAILKYPSAATHPGAGLIDVCRPLRPTLICFRGVPEMLSPERQSLLRARRSKNSGGGIAPTAFGDPYRGRVLQRQRLPEALSRDKCAAGAG